jgi:pyruvate/2-oxoglutarate dehydrogenase complex dihydrolipoamide acyltransferase (E2) component
LQIGQEVAFGVPIARIIGAGERAEEVPQRAPAPVEAPAPPLNPRSPPRFSQEASALLKQFGLSESMFNTGFVTSAQVRAVLPGATPPPPPPPLRIAGPAPNLDRRKQTEIETLQNGAGNTMLSVLGKTLGPVHLRRDADDIFAGRITDLVIYEAARLMHKFPKLNAQYADGRVTLHDHVHAGMAIDGGGKLVVYGIEHADQLGLPDLSRIVGDAVTRYMANALTAAEMTRATFTVTDLSADDLDFVLPLLPRGQSCIIGITHDQASGFRLFAGFDHRVTEGREVAAFLTALGERVTSFGRRNIDPAKATSCSFCGKTLAEAIGRAKDKGFLSVVGAKGEPALCCASCWNGW